MNQEYKCVGQMRNVYIVKRDWVKGKGKGGRWMASGKVADCGRIRKEKSKSGRLWDEGKTVRKKMNGVGGVHRLRTDPQRKEQKWGE